jgi:hypothetical protein
MYYCIAWIIVFLTPYSHYKEVYDFVFVEKRVEKALRALNIPLATWGMDVAIVRQDSTGGELEVRFLEQNARTTMGKFLSISNAKHTQRVREVN